MLNNKGFTLVELLVVMLILVSISLIAVSGITASLERQDEKECENQIEMAINAAKIYFSLSEDPISAAQDGVRISTLIEGDYFEEKDVDKNYIKDENGVVKKNALIKYNSDEFKYDIIDGCKIKD